MKKIAINYKANNILYLTYDGLNDPLGQSQIVPYLNGLAEKDWKIHVISCEKEKGYSGLHKNISWHALNYHKHPLILSTVYDIWKLKHVARKLVISNNIRIVHCRSYIPSLIGLELKRKYGIKFIFDMRGFWADERVESGLWNINNPVYRWIYNYFKRKEKVLIKEADSIISLTETGKNEILNNSDLGLPAFDREDKISIIPTCVDTNLFDHKKVSEQQKHGLLKSLGIDKDNFVLMYVGSMGTWYMLGEMFFFFKLFKKENPKSRFLILTNDLTYKNQDPDIIVRNVAREEVPTFLSICNATICFIKPTYSKKASSATKIWESLAMGKPVIVNSGWGDVNAMFKKNNLGCLVESFDRHSFENIIRNFSVSLCEPGTLRDFTLKKAGLNKGVETYHNIYKNLVFRRIEIKQRDEIKRIEVEY